MVGPSGCMTVPAAGFTVLVNPDQPSLDVVFVHGFKGSPTGTWTKRGIDRSDHDNEPDEPPSKARKLGFLSRPHQGTNPDTSSCFWPQELLPEILPTARVLTYGYDTKIQHVTDRPVSTATIYDIAWDFLVALEAERQDDPPRPILFIAHSLGGIVVKEMLRRSSGCLSTQTHLHAIFESTTGIVFFGTPHGGANPHGFLVHIAKKVFKAVGYEANESIINALLPNSERLRELTDCFGTMAQQRKWIIHSFQEIYRIKLLRQKVVEDIASRLNLPDVEVTEHICDDHMGMTKFIGINDPEFKKVAAALRRINQSQSQLFGLSNCQPLTEDRKKALRESLDFEQLRTRHASIKSAHAMTCKWLLEKSQYVDWLDPIQLEHHHGFLWIKGKPGTGKSTIMKFVLANARKTMRNKVFISFFFNARGNDLEKSTIGMYRSLLLQMLEELPGLWSVLDFPNPTVSNHEPNWNLELLKSLFEDAIRHLGTSSLVCFVDALDECDESQIRDMVSSWEYLGEMAVNERLEFRVCFSSRHYPYITMETGLSFTLEDQEGHDEDIVKYVDSELKIGKTRLAEKIRSEIQEKAAGVFMWVVLVVQILNKEHDSGRIYLLQQRLKDIPSDLHELFRDIFIRDIQNRNEVLLCIQWVLYSRTPLKPEQLYFAIIAGAGPQHALKWNRDEISKDDIRRYILHCSKGLVQATHSERPTIQFIHEAVRDFLLEKNGINSLWPDVGDQIESRSYEQLKHSCLRYIRADICNEIGLDYHAPMPSRQDCRTIQKSIATSFPFLDHAVQNVLYYADKAAACGIPQHDFLNDFSNISHLQEWISLSNVFGEYHTPRYSLKASLLYILAMKDASNLIDSHPSIIASLNVENEYYGCALLAAIATKSYQAFQAFRRGLAGILPPDVATRLLASRDVESVFRSTQLDYNFKFPQDESLLSRVSQYNDGALFSAVLKVGRFPVDLRNPNGRSALSYAAEGSTEVVKVLLATNEVDVDSKDNKGRTPLSWAARAGSKEVVELLLQTHKVEIDSKCDEGRSPLSRAAASRSEEVVNLILQTGKVDINSRDNEGHTPFSRAVWAGSKRVVDLLLRTGKVDVESKTNGGYTPLLLAVWAGSEDIVEMLLQNEKVDAKAPDQAGRTPLWWAVELKRKDIAELLLKSGKFVHEVELHKRLY